MKEYETYRVKDGDTLRSIAEQLQISVRDLMAFHNAHSCTLLRDDFIGVSMFKEICIPADLDGFRRKHAPNRCPLHYEDVKLACENVIVNEATEMILKEQRMVQAQTVQRFSIKQEEMDGHAVCVIDNLEFLKRQVSSQYKPLADAVSFLGQPLNHLVLGINPDGAIAKIINQEEISERWQSLKQTKEAQALFADETVGQDVEQAMDADYKQTLKVVNESLKYRLLCPDFFGEHFLSESRERNTTLQLASNFFPSQKIRFKLEESCELSQTKETLCVSQRYHAAQDMQKELSGAYNSTLKDYYVCHWNI
ncbi:MAG: LysM domain-containing protein [Prevotella sp.]|nr:LysM domain-containing protein [Prevotella sp.]